MICTAFSGLYGLSKLHRRLASPNSLTHAYSFEKVRWAGACMLTFAAISSLYDVLLLFCHH
jgi:hypothetical protein